MTDKKTGAEKKATNMKKGTKKAEKKSPDANKTKSNRNNSARNSLIAVGVVLVLVLLMLIPFGGRSVLARTLDSMGMEEAAQKVDKFTGSEEEKEEENKDEAVSKCKELMGSYTQQQLYPSKASMTEEVEIKLASEKYEDLFNLKMIMSPVFDMDEKEAFADVDLELKVNVDKIETIVKESGTAMPSLDIGELSIAAGAEGVATTKDAFIKVDRVDIKTNNVDIQRGLDDWYRYEYPITPTQEDGVVEMVDLVKELVEVKTENVISQETTEKVTSLVCNLVEDIDEKGVTELSFGGEKSSVNAKKYSLEIGDLDYEKMMTEEMPEVLDVLTQDEVLRTFIKGKYGWLIDLEKSAQKIDPEADFSLPETQEGFDSEIDEGLDSFNKEEFTKQMEEEFGDYNKTLEEAGVKQQIEYLDIYVDDQTGEIVAYSVQIKLVFEGEMLDEIAQDSSKEVARILKDGILYNISVYNIENGESAREIVVPETYKSLEGDFEDDFVIELQHVVVELQKEPIFAQYAQLFGVNEMLEA